jgi:bifunctional DNA-binding transcriptional regulator/antitoxin component of YhaV-PrlF toxin-antitoxin module
MEDFSMPRLTITAKGQITLKRELLQHLGVQPGEKLEISKLPDGRVEVKAAHSRGNIERFLGLLAGKTNKIATIEEMNDAAAAGWAGKE